MSGRIVNATQLEPGRAECRWIKHQLVARKKTACMAANSISAARLPPVEFVTPGVHSDLFGKGESHGVLTHILKT